MNIDFNTIIVVVSCGATIGSMLLNNRAIFKNLDDKIMAYREDMEKRVITEKKHALALAELRMRSIEKDVDEMFPRLRGVEEAAQGNSLTIHQLEANCIRHRLKNNGGTP